MARSRVRSMHAALRNSFRDVTLVSNCWLADEDWEFFREVLEIRSELAVDLLGYPLADLFRRGVRSSELHIQAYFKSFKSLKEVLLSSIDSGEWIDWPSFKRLVGRTHPIRWIVATVKPFFPLDDRSFRRLFQWLVFDEHLNLSSASYEDEMMGTYLEDEAFFSSLEYPDQTVSEVRAVLNEWLASYHPVTEQFRPHHGSGATAELKWHQATPYEKCKHFKWDSRLRKAIDDFLFNEDEHELMFAPEWQDTEDWRCCRIIFVPKTALTNRVISAEPTSLMWFQQGFVAGLDDWLKSHSSLTHYHPNTQVVNQLLAYLGSRSGSHATLDLSKASDSVTMRLVELCFGETNLYPILTATRSDFAELPSGQRIRLAKFAPMGSRFCFPVESLLFAACCEVAVRRIKGRKSGLLDYSVFGDDIAIAARYVRALVEILESFHFRVNTTKSFTSPQAPFFRESCGVFALNGRDISPVRLSRRLTPLWSGKDGVTPEAWSSWCSFSNQLYLQNYRCTRRRIQSRMRQFIWYGHTMRYSLRELRSVMFVHLPYLLTDGPIDRAYHTHSRYRADLYRSEAFAVTEVQGNRYNWTPLSDVPRFMHREPDDPRDQMDGAIMLFLWLWDAETRSGASYAGYDPNVELDVPLSAWDQYLSRPSTVLTADYVPYL